MLAWSPRLLAHAALHMTKSNQQTVALDVFGGYRRGGPRVHRQSEHRLTDPDDIARMLYPSADDYELRGSQAGSQAEATERESVGRVGGAPGAG